MPGSGGVPFFDRKQPDTMRTGFGEGTVSPPAMVMRTLDKGLEAGRRVVPTAPEILADMQERRAADRERLRTANESREAVRGPATDYAAQARDFVSTVNRAASVAQSRLNGQPEPQSDEGARLRINGQSLSYGSVGSQASSTLNVMA